MAASTELPVNHSPLEMPLGTHGEGLGHVVSDLKTHLEHAVAFEAAELFGDYIAWLEAAGRSRGVDAHRLHAEIDALASDDTRLSPFVLNVLDVGRKALDAAASASIQMPDHKSAFRDRRRRYLGFLLAGLRNDALGLLRQATQDGLSADQIYLEILAPALREVGWLWQIGRITVAQEHFCTAVTQFAMTSFYDHLAEIDWNGRTVVVANPGGERHEMGARMVADLLERAGWNAVFLGANTPVNEMPHALNQHRADLLALSCTMTPHLADVKAAIHAVRAEPSTAATPILVGGRPFGLSDGLCQRIGADGTAEDAAGAVRVAATLADGSGAGKRATR